MLQKCARFVAIVTTVHCNCQNLTHICIVIKTKLQNMHIKSFNTLSVLRHKHKTVLCVIKVLPRNIKFYHGQIEPHQTRHWMQIDHWAKFDEGVESIVAKCSKRHNWQFNEEHFKLNPTILVRVKQTKVPTDTLCRCVDDFKVKPEDVGISIECTIEYSDNGKWDNDTICSKHEKIDVGTKLLLASEEDLEYQPQYVSTQAGKEVDISPNLFAYVPYTPSPTNGVSKVVKESEIAEEPYSPKAIDDCSPEKISQPSEPIPEYCPKRIRTNSYVTESVLSSQDDNTEKVNGLSPKGPPRQLRKKNVRENINGLQRREKGFESTETCQNRYVDEDNTTKTNRISRKKTKTKSKEVLKDFRSKDDFKSNDKHKNNEETSSKVRRPSRSPVRKVRDIDGAQKNQKLPITHNDLFGSEEDECKDPKMRSSKTTLKTSKRVNKRDRSNDNEGQVGVLTKWLSKKPPNIEHSTKPIKETSKKRKPESNRAENDHTEKHDTDLENPANKIHINNTLELMKFFDEIEDPPPEKVEMLTLNKMTIKEIEDTFDRYKPLLDEIFQKYCRKEYVRHHHGINHNLVNNVLDETKQLQMLHKLRENYEQDCDGSPLYYSHFSNALMPEWIIGIFIKKYGLSRENAIAHLKAQNAYKFYLDTKELHT